MRWSQSHVCTLREVSSNEAEIPSYKFMVKAGLIKKVAPGIYTYQNMAIRALRKIKQIIREELDQRGCIEVLMPMVHPRSLWEETGRWADMGKALLRFENRNEQEFCLGPTHEEVVVDLVRHDLKSYRDLPKNLYQIQTKYRDEIRPRFGLLRGREFIMKDAYSFDLDPKSAKQSYQKMWEAYRAIFDRLKLDYRIVQADSGNIGGSQSHEFHVLARHGEDILMVCDQCAYNLEIAPVLCPSQSISPEKNKNRPEKQELQTPHVKTIKGLSQLLDIAQKDLVKTLFFKEEDGSPFCVLLRGSDEIAPLKMKNHFQWNTSPEMLTKAEVFDLTGASPGSCGPVGLKNCPVFADNGLKSMTTYIVGANKEGCHLKNVVPERDFHITAFGDFRRATQVDQCPQCSGKYQQLRGIEVGHIFYLGQKYSKAMGATYLDEHGQQKVIEMGCYGLGVSRTLQAAIEQNHDKDGILWPKSIAPYHVHICHLDINHNRANQVVSILERKLEGLGIDVFVDDRNERPGVKFKDADLLGFPFRIVVGQRHLSDLEDDVHAQKVEVFERPHLTVKREPLTLNSAIDFIAEHLPLTKQDVIFR